MPAWLCWAWLWCCLRRRRRKPPRKPPTTEGARGHEHHRRSDDRRAWRRSTPASAGDAFTVTAPAPAALGARDDARQAGDLPRGRLPEHGRGEPADRRRARATSRRTSSKGGGFVGIGSAIETDPAWSFLTSILGTRSSGRTVQQTGTVKVFDRVHDASKIAPALLGPQRPLVQLRDATSAASVARPRDGRRGPVRPAAAGPRRSTASRAAPTAPTTRSPSARTTRAGARSTPASATRRGVRRDADHAPQGRDHAGRPAAATRSTPTAARPSCATTSRRRSARRRTCRSRSASTSSRTAASSRRTASARCACTTRPRARPRSSPTSRTRPCR